MCKGCGSELELTGRAAKIKRTGSGSIDFEYYSSQSRNERSNSFVRFF